MFVAKSIFYTNLLAIFTLQIFLATIASLTYTFFTSHVYFGLYENGEKFIILSKSENLK